MMEIIRFQKNNKTTTKNFCDLILININPNFYHDIYLHYTIITLLIIFFLFFCFVFFLLSLIGFIHLISSGGFFLIYLRYIFKWILFIHTKNPFHQNNTNSFACSVWQYRWTTIFLFVCCIIKTSCMWTAWIAWK